MKLLNRHYAPRIEVALRTRRSISLIRHAFEVCIYMPHQFRQGMALLLREWAVGIFQGRPSAGPGQLCFPAAPIRVGAAALAPCAPNMLVPGCFSANPDALPNDTPNQPTQPGSYSRPAVPQTPGCHVHRPLSTCSPISACAPQLPQYVSCSQNTAATLLCPPRVHILLPSLRLRPLSRRIAGPDLLMLPAAAQRFGHRHDARVHNPPFGRPKIPALQLSVKGPESSCTSCPWLSASLKRWMVTASG